MPSKGRRLVCKKRNACEIKVCPAPEGNTMQLAAPDSVYCEEFAFLGNFRIAVIRPEHSMRAGTFSARERRAGIMRRGYQSA